MPRQKVTNAEFLERTGHLLADPNRPPKLRELAEAAGLSEGGVNYRLLRLGIRRKVRFTKPDAA